MDLSFSPDTHAWVCYLIVLFFGVLTGWREVIAQLKDSFVIWRYPAAWALMFILGIGPVLLFWLLDRVGALHDTSVIAAAIVGIAYTQILKGDSQYKAPGETSPIWNFLSWWRERVAKAVQDRVGTNLRAFDQMVCNCLSAPAKPGQTATAGNPTPLEEVTAIALKHASDPIAFKASIAAERSRLEAATPPLGPEVIEYKVAEFVYREMIRIDEVRYRKLLVEEGFVQQRQVDKYFGSRAMRLITGLAMPVVIVGLVLFVVFDGTGVVKYAEREYLISRLSKTSGTVNDLDRVTARLIHVVAIEPPAAQGRPVAADFWLLPLLDLLGDSTLPMPRIDATLRVFLATRDKKVVDNHLLAERLMAMLRTSSVDARRRIHLSLVYFSPEKALDKDATTPAFKALAAWNPTEGDSITEIESKIDDWRDYWSKVKR